MKRSDIQHLARLSRITFSDTEIDNLEKELPQIVEYVSVVNDIAGEEREPQLSDRFNVLRSDNVANEPEQFTADIMSEMPDTDGRYMKVKKIISQDK